jgi:hypothetical protein
LGVLKAEFETPEHYLPVCLAGHMGATYRGRVTHRRLAYEDPSSSREMLADCLAVEEALHLPSRMTPAERTARAAMRPAPSFAYDDFPREVEKPTIAVSEAAARLGAAVHLHLD